jgi:hypothetical protein
MVAVPDRATSVFAATVSCTIPFPVPLVPAATAIQGTLLDAVQAQVVPAVTETVAVPPAGSTVSEAGEIEYEHAGAACVTVTVRPATVSDPDRDTAAGPTAKVTVPGALPEPPPVIVIQGSLLNAVHGHPGAVLTVTLLVPPSAPNDRASGDTS